MTDEPTVRPRARREAPEPQRSKVSLWRAGNGKPRWSIAIVDGADESTVDRLVDLALRAERRLNEKP